MEKRFDAQDTEKIRKLNKDQLKALVEAWDGNTYSEEDVAN